MRAHAVGVPVPDWADFEIDGLHRAEGPLHAREILVGLNCMGGGEIFGRHAGAHDIDAIEFGLGSDLIDLAGPAEVSIANVERKVLGHLLGIDYFADGETDLGGGAQRRSLPPDLRLNPRELPLGRNKQRLALAGALFGQFAITTYDEPVPWKAGRFDLGEIAVVEQREL